MIKTVKQLSAVTEDDEKIVGRKIVVFSKIQSDKKLLLPCSIITSEDFLNFITRTGIKGQLMGLIGRAGNADEGLFEISEKIQGLIIKTDFDEETKEDVEDAYHSLDINYDKTRIKDLLSSKGSPVVSVIGCDMLQKPGEKALKLPVHLNVIGYEYLESAIKHCWASQFSKESMRKIGKVEDVPSNVSILIQKMVSPVKSIIAYSINPENNDNTEIVIDAAFGLPEALTNVDILCDRYAVGKANLQINRIMVKEQKFALKADYDSDQIVKVEVPKEQQSKQKLNDKEIWEIAGVVRRINRDLSVELQIEFLDDTQRRFISNIELLGVPFVDMDKKQSEDYMSREKKPEKKTVEEVIPELDDEFYEPKISEATEEIHEAGLAKTQENLGLNLINTETQESKITTEIKMTPLELELLEKNQKIKNRKELVHSFILQILPVIKEKIGFLKENERDYLIEIISDIENKKDINYQDFLMLLEVSKEDLF